MGNTERKIIVGWGLTLAIVIFILIYWLNESSRMAVASEQFWLLSVHRGAELYDEQCASCHGDEGEGILNVGPPLNSADFLKMFDNQAIRDVTAEGLPNTLMPAFLEEEGGPLRASQIGDLVAFTRNWEGTAPLIAKATPVIDAASLYAQHCAGCHGPNGEGTDAVSLVLNSKGFLGRTDDALLYQLTAEGRPEQAMPAFAGVLSNEKINSLVAFMRAWEATAPEVEPGGATLYARYCAFCHGAKGEGAENVSVVLSSEEFLAAHDDAGLRKTIAEGHENMPPWSATMTEDEIEKVVEFMRGWATGEAAPTGPDGAELYAANCAMCHGASGDKLDPALSDKDYLDSKDDAFLGEKINEGVPGKMIPFKAKLAPAETEAIIAFMRDWPVE